MNTLIVFLVGSVALGLFFSWLFFLRLAWRSASANANSALGTAFAALAALACFAPFVLFAWQVWTGFDLVMQGQEDQRSALLTKSISTAFAQVVVPSVISAFSYFGLMLLSFWQTDRQ